MRRGMYLLPSLFTLGNLFLGFTAVIEAMNGAFLRASIMIFVAAVLDALDGRIARLTGTESDFGTAFDSLADVLTFGSAPALISYLWGTQALGRIGWLAPLFFLVATTTRLARFNVQVKTVDSRFFVGLPTPAAAGAVMSLIFAAPSVAAGGRWLDRAMIVLLFTIGMLMVSTFRYPSFKGVDLRKRRSYRLLIPVTGMLMIATINPQAFFLSLAAAYTCYGPVAWLVGRSRQQAEAPTETEARKAP